MIIPEHTAFGMRLLHPEQTAVYFDELHKEWDSEHCTLSTELEDLQQCFT